MESGGGFCRDYHPSSLVEDLDRQGRKEELARLTGGSHLSQTILEGAEELLQEAEGYKAEMTAR